MQLERKTGVVIPLAALYDEGQCAIGDFLSLKPFADFCSQCNLTLIQLLPVNDTGTQSSPYSGLSANALHPLYIRISALPEFSAALEQDKSFASAWKSFCKQFKKPSLRFDYDAVLTEKTKLLHLLYSFIEKKYAKEGSSQATSLNKEITAFIKANKWVIPYAVYKNLKDVHNQASWKEWDKSLQSLTKDQIQLRWSNRALKSSHQFFVWCQMRAAAQFSEAADYVRQKGIILKGDIPILMNEDSADAWAYKDFFDHSMRAGAPPSGDSPMGQNWGFPTYNWNMLAADNYSWWKERVQTAARYYGAFRIDHILGFFRIWAVNEKESTAYLGHTMPYNSIPRTQFEQAGFNKDRLKWLSEPHIPTGIIEDITWNHEEAVHMLSQIADRIGNEELWNFKSDITSDSQIYASHFSDDEGKDARVKEALCIKWRDRALIQIEKDRFIRVWSYGNSTAWKSLSWDEQQHLNELFARNDETESALWKQQALDVLTPIVNASDMIPCAEDLGASFSALPQVLEQLNINSLCVIRWCRSWSEPGQPFIPFAQYREQSVATTSVHDSSTLRQWWTEEKDAVRAYLNLWNDGDKNPLFENATPIHAEDTFSPQVAQFLLQSAADCASAWYINPLQDYLFLDQNYYLENANDERINIPGTCNTFNWTYRMLVSIQELSKNETLISKIQGIAAKHQTLPGGNR